MDEYQAQERVRRRAYEIWERQARPGGLAEELSEQAKASLDFRSVPKSARPGVGKRHPALGSLAVRSERSMRARCRRPRHAACAACWWRANVVRVRRRRWVAGALGRLT
ncbi:DUF2934 domain-containing protein [Caballeronia temeraria]|uniref:DUF2934 domain-containing protein n=1 Tax=Caballeronia temeraria TaxID=1777137 RepID=UPI00094088E4